MRTDRIATLGFFHPVARVLGGSASKASAILMYHSVREAPEDGVHPYFRLNTSPQQFALHMDVLAASGWEVAPLAHLLALKTPRQAGRRRVAITFDDGYEDFLTHAFPELEKRGFPSSVFLPTEYISTQARSFNGKRCLTWGQVSELSRAGVHFGSHTSTHPQLYSLPAKSQDEEVRRSKAEIEDRLGIVVDAFSYPFAFPQHDGGFRTRLRGILEDCGYAYGVSTILGRVRHKDDRFFARRLPVNTLDDARLLSAKLEGGYDWLHGFQYMAKALRRVLP